MDPLVQEVDGRLHVSVVAQSPFVAYLSPVFGAIRAPCPVAELALVLCAKKQTLRIRRDCLVHAAAKGEREREPTDFLS